MFEKHDFTIRYLADGRLRTAAGENEDLSLRESSDGKHLKITLVPKREIELIRAGMSCEYAFGKDDCVLPNGYQTWTLTTELRREDVQKGIRFPLSKIKIGRDIASVFGDYSWKEYAEVPGVFHGYSFGYVRRDRHFDFIGSLNERTGYTIINFDMNANRILLEKELEGKTISEPYEIMDAFFADGSYDDVFDAYFAALGTPPCRVGRTCGYTSWYNYFTDIDEEIILRDLEGLTRADNVKIFQIDDGHQTAVGDWTSTDESKFPHGMKFIADKIHEKNLLAGLWMAPFYAQKNSRVAAEHPDWLVKDGKGKYTYGYVGGRTCRTLNFYEPGCADYIRGFFDTVLNDWGYDLVKLDFLCTACMVPYGNRTRGEIMSDAVDFLRECCGDKLMLGCGVPLAPAFGKMDFCRIGSDVDIKFKPRFLYSLTNNEMVCTQTSIKNAIFRRGLNGRAFMNDPDVFFMRDTNLTYTEGQKRLVAEINKTFGGLLFVSDDIGSFSDERLAFLNEIYAENKRIVEHVDYLGHDTATVHFTENGERHRWTLNWLTGENRYD